MMVRKFRDKKIKEIMGPPQEYSSYDVAKNTKIQDAVSKLEQNRYRMLVVTENKVPIGLVTQSDLLKGLGSGEKIDASNMVEGVMNRDFIKISEEKSIDDAISLMNSLEINKLVVVGADSTFKGLINKLDIIKQAQQLL